MFKFELQRGRNSFIYAYMCEGSIGLSYLNLVSLVNRDELLELLTKARCHEDLCSCVIKTLACI